MTSFLKLASDKYEKGVAMLDDLMCRAFQSGDIINDYYSVEFSIKKTPFLFQFKIWSKSPEGMSILVRKSSLVLKHLKVGQTLIMRYYRNGVLDYSSGDVSNPIITESLKTVIKGISSFGKRHCSIVFSILGDPTTESRVYH